MNIILPHNPDGLIRDVIRELPVGAVQTWEGIGLLLTGSDSPFYMFVITAEKCFLLQFKHPKFHIKQHEKALMYHDGQTVAKKEFLNRTFCPTFFVFDNYFHAYAFEQKMKGINIPVEVQKFK